MLSDQTTRVGHGYAEPVSASQATFREVLQAMSRPGIPVRLSQHPAAPPELPGALATIALTLCDYETPIWIDEELSRHAAVRRYLSFNTGAPIAGCPSEASFALCTSAQSMPRFAQFAQGTLEYPDRSTTVIAMIEALSGGPSVALEGPGIDGRISIAPIPLPIDFSERLKCNREMFPRGIDLVLVCGDQIVGLPRSVRVLE